MTWLHAGSGGGPGVKYFIATADSAAIDAYARWRVSTPTTLFDSKQIWSDPDLANDVENFPLFWDNQELSGSGTTTAFNLGRASTTLSVSANTAGTRARQTRQRFNYQPGKSDLLILTLRTGETPAGITKRIGFFDGNDGLFFEDLGGIWRVVNRSNVSGTAIDTVISQTDWNLDTMDGNGPSGVLLNKQAVEIGFIDFEWLGSGRIRFGYFIDGIPITCHQMLYANILSSVYMSTPNLPIRAEISNDGSGAVSSLEQICSTVISEGGVNISGMLRGADLGTAAASEIQAAAVGTKYAVCGIRLKPAYLSAHVQEVDLSMVETTGGSNVFLWSLHFNPTLTSGLTYTDQPQSAVQFGVGDADPADVLTDVGHVIGGGYASGSTKNVQIDLESALRIGSLIDGTPDELVLAVSPVSTNQDILGSMSWREAW